MIARCPICERMIALRRNGVFYRHGFPPRKLCPGSGFRPVTLHEYAWKPS